MTGCSAQQPRKVDSYDVVLLSYCTCVAAQPVALTLAGKERFVTETDYWASLEFRICRELARMEENAIRFLWCDGLIPEEYLVDAPSPHITGRAWICNGRMQEQWEFALVLEHSVRSLEEVSWASLLPSEDVTGWLAVDLEGRRIRLTPSRVVA